MKEGTIISQNGTPFIISAPKSGKLHSFDMVLVKNWNKVPRVIIAMLSDYTLWHRRMGHAHQCAIKHLGKNTEGGPHQTIEALTGACEGCEKGKSQRLPFPTSKYRAKWPLDHVHTDLDEIPVLSIGGYKYTATYLDDYSSFVVMFYLKHKNEEFAAFKTYKVWAERQLGTTLNAGNLIEGESSCQMSKRLIWQRMEQNIKHPCQILCNKMDKWKGSSKLP